MKILFLYNHPHPVHGAWAESIAAEFLQDRVSFRIPGISRIVKSLITLMKIPKETDIILCESSSQLISGSIWKRFNKNKKLACILSDPKWYYLQNKRVSRKIYFWMLKQADVLIPTSPLMKSFIPKELQERASIVFPYVNIKQYLNENQSQNAHTIIFAGRMGYEKGADKTLKAFQLIKKKIPDAKIYFIGFGELKEPLENKKIKDAIFTGWSDSPQEYYKLSSLYLSLARIDPAGIAPLEAMLSGVIPLVSRGVGNAYIVEKLDKKLIVKDEEGAAKKIISLWNNKETMQQFAKRGRDLAKRYGYERSIQEFLAAMKPLGITKVRKPSPQDAEKYKPSLKPY